MLTNHCISYNIHSFFQYFVFILYVAGLNIWICCRPRISSLRVTHAEIVNRSVKYGGSEHSLNYIKTCIQHLPSCCILDDNGSPISWALLDESCAIRMGFTFPEYRRVGYMKVVLATLARKVHMMGFPVHLSVEENNTASLHACKNMGFTLYPDLYLTFKLIPSSLPWSSAVQDSIRRYWKTKDNILCV